MDAIAILDFGSQTSQLIARRVREAHVYCELFPYDVPRERALALNLRGWILSGGPASVYEPEAPTVPDFVLESGLPILGICYGMQALTQHLGGRVAPSSEKEFGPAEIEVLAHSPLLTVEGRRVWMSHGDRIERQPDGFKVLARSPNSPIAAIGDDQAKRYGLLFHPEVQHTQQGSAILRAFVRDVCGARAEWTPEAIIEQAVERLRAQLGDEPILAAVSGGVDSSVAAALTHRAVGPKLTCVFVNTGLLRAGEVEETLRVLGGVLGERLIPVDASQAFLQSLQGVTDPEAKRKIIGQLFIRTFEQQAERVGRPRFLLQGTIYPDVVESSGPDRRVAARIKTHHNVGGLPEDLTFELVEPLRYLFKDEVRAVGTALGLPESLIWRQPFPGPGLAVRCLGEVTFDRLERLRAADRILLTELGDAGLLRDETAQAFAVLLPVRSVGVMGDQRTYAETVALRAVTTDDFMTADWARIPFDLLARISRRIVNEVQGVNRVVYDVTSKPPATIEWE